MPGTLLVDDWRNAVEDQLKQHVSGLLQAAQKPLQVLQDAPRPQLPQIDPGAIAQQLQQTAQQALIPLQQPQAPQAPQVDQQAVMQQLTNTAQQALIPLNQPQQPAAGSVAPTLGSAPSPTSGAPEPSLVAGYIRQAATQRGIDPETAVRVAGSEGLHTYVGDNNSSFGPFQLHYGNVATGGNAVGGLGDAFTAQTGLDARDPSTWAKQVDFALDHAARNGWGPWHGAQAIGIGDQEGIGGRVANAAGQVADRVQGAARDISQFGDSALSNAEAYAACGPAAAVRFAERFGRNPTLREAVDLATQVGWTAAQGMAGITSQQSLMGKLGVATKIVTDVASMAREALSGNPVTISTPGHYFYADGYDPQSGAFHVGRSGTDLRGGKEWMTQADMEGRMGAIQGALLADSPLVPSKSAAVLGGDTTQRKQPDVINVVQDQQRAPIYHDAMQTAAGFPGGPPGGGGQDKNGLQVISDAVGQVADEVQRAAQGANTAVGGFFSDVGRGAQQTQQDVSGAVGGLGHVLSGEAAAEARAAGWSPAFEAQAREVANQPMKVPGPGEAAFAGLGTLIPGNPFFAPGNAPGPNPVAQQDIMGKRQEINQAIDESPAFQNYPLPVVAGVGAMVTKVLLDPMTYVGFGPASKFGTAVGEGITESTGRQLVGKLTASAVTNGLLNAEFELQKPNPDPTEVGKQFAMGFVGGPVVEFAPSTLLKVGQALMARADDFVGKLPVEDILRNRQSAQANARFAVGLGPGQDVLHGQAVPRPGYEPGTPEHTVETFLQGEARRQGTARPDITGDQIRAQPGMAGSLTRGLQEVREATEAGLPAARWYQEIVQQVRKDTGQDINPREAAVLMGATGGNAGVQANYHAMLSVFDAMRQARPDLVGMERLDVPGIMATQAFKDVQALVRADNAYIDDDMLARVMRGYRTGEVPVPSGAKLSSYTQDFLHGLSESYSPYSTQDVHQGRLFGARPDLQLNAQGKPAPLPNVSENDQAYRTMHALTNWVAREMHLPPDQAQAAAWTSFRTLWTDPVIGPALQADRISLSDAIRQGKASGILDPQVLRTGGLAEVAGPRSGAPTSWSNKLNDVRDRIRANGSYNAPPPESATALNDIALYHPSIQSTAQQRANLDPGGFQYGTVRGPKAGIARPVGNEPAAGLRELALGDQPIMRVRGEVQVDANGKIPWLAPEHTVQRVGGQTYVSVVGVGDDAAHVIGQRLGADRFNHADPNGSKTGGLAIKGLGSEQRVAVVEALQRNGLPVLHTAEALRIPLVDTDVRTAQKLINQSLAEAAAQGAVSAYSGATHAVRSTGAGAAGRVGDSALATGRSDLPAGDRLRAAVFRDEPLPGAAEPGLRSTTGGGAGGAIRGFRAPGGEAPDLSVRSVSQAEARQMVGQAYDPSGRVVEPPGPPPAPDEGAPRPRRIEDVQSNPYALREPRPGDAPMSTDEMVDYAGELDTRLEDVQNRSNAIDEMLRNPNQRVERPPWAAGYTNVQLAEIARRHDVSPYQENWWDAAGLETGSGEVREQVGQGNLRGTPSQRELSPTELRAEKARLDKEADDILTAHEQMASAPADVNLVRPAQRTVTPPGELPFDMPGVRDETPDPVPQTEAQGGRDEGARLAQEVVLGKGRGTLRSVPGEVTAERGGATMSAILSPERAAEIEATPPSARTVANMPNLDAMLGKDMPEMAAQIRKAAEDNPELFEKYRQGVISMDSLRNDLASRTGLTMEDWLKTPVGKGFNEQEQMALQAAAIEAGGRLQDMGETIMERGGVNALTPEQVAYGIREMLDARQVLAVARGGRSTAGRSLNVLKQRFDRTLASSITAGAEAIAARRQAATARRAAVKATKLLKTGRDLEIEKNGAVASASRTPGTPRNIVEQIADAYDQLDRYQAMTLHEKADVFTGLQAERKARAAARKEALANRAAPDALLSALKAELKAEQDIFAKRKDNWETQAFWDTQANEIAAEKRRAFRGQLYLEQQRRVAQIAAKEADLNAKRSFDAELRRKTNQQAKAENLLKAIGGVDASRKLLGEFMVALNDPNPAVAAKFIKGLNTPNMWQRSNIVRVAGLVSAPITQMINVGGNTAIAGLEMTAVRPTVVAIDAIRAAITGGERQAYRAELLPMMRAWGPGFVGALPNAARLLKTGIHPADAADLSKIRPGFGSGSDVVDAAVEMPLRALGAEDILFRGGSASAHGMRVGMRQAIREGFQGRAAEGRARDILKNLEDYPDLAAEVHDATARDVFQEQREVPFIGNLRESPNVALARSQVLPFVKTPMNITAQGAALSPLGAIGTVQAARASRAGMTAAQAGRQTLLAEERLARTMIGTAIFGAGVALGGAGMLTADYPKDRTTLPQGWRPWSLRLEDPITKNTYYVPLQNIGPMGFPLAMSAILTDPTHKLDPATGQPKSVLSADEQLNAATAIGRYVIDNTFLQGINDFNDLLHDPRTGASKFAEPWVASFGPYSSLNRELLRTFGVAQRNPREGVMGLVDAMEANYPGLSGNVPEATTALGDARTQGATGVGRLVPARYDIERDEPTLQALRSAGVRVPDAPKAVNYGGGHIDLTETEQDQLKRARGAAIRDAVSDYANDPKFQALSVSERNKYLQQMVSRSSAMANRQWLFDLPGNSIRDRLKPQAVPEPYYLGEAAG